MSRDKAKYNEYMRKYVLERYHRRRQFAIELLGGKCVVCGTTENLQFHHIDKTTKSFTIAKLSGCNEIDFINEVHKCQLLCQKCHNLKTLESKGQKPAQGTHGTLSSYRYCKCDLCRKAWNDHNKQYKAKKRNKDK